MKGSGGLVLFIVEGVFFDPIGCVRVGELRVGIDLLCWPGLCCVYIYSYESFKIS